jgi:probable rRNA maturation factor
MSDQSSLQVQIDPRWEQQVDAAALQRAITIVFAVEGVPSAAELSLVIVGDDEMSRLHEAYRSEPGTTDVLAFPYDASETGEVEEMSRYLGDIIVCYEQAERQAASEGHSTAEELVLLAVHGTLHLLGYDDEVPEEKSRMWRQQQTIMERLGLRHIAS